MAKLVYHVKSWEVLLQSGLLENNERYTPLTSIDEGDPKFSDRKKCIDSGITIFLGWPLFTSSQHLLTIRCHPLYLAADTIPLVCFVGTKPLAVKRRAANSHVR